MILVHSILNVDDQRSWSKVRGEQARLDNENGWCREVEEITLNVRKVKKYGQRECKKMGQRESKQK